MKKGGSAADFDIILNPPFLSSNFVSQMLIMLTRPTTLGSQQQIRMTDLSSGV